MTERDWQKDMELAKKATTGPWVSVNEPEYDGDIEAPNPGLCIARGVRAEDKAFIVEARTGWPAALEEIGRLKAQLTAMHSVLSEILDIYVDVTCSACNQPLPCTECPDGRRIRKAISILKEMKRDD